MDQSTNLVDGDHPRLGLRPDDVEVGKIVAVDLATGGAFAARLERDSGLAGGLGRLAIQGAGQLDGMRLKAFDIAPDKQLRMPKPPVGQTAAEQLGWVGFGLGHAVGHGAVILATLGQGDSGIGHFVSAWPSAFLASAANVWHFART